MTADARASGRVSPARCLIAGVASAVGLLAAGCSLPVDEQVTRYANEDLPSDIANTTTTSTTTTTTTTTTLPGDDVVVDDSTTTSTTPIVSELEPIRLYYTVGFSDQLQPVTIERPPPITSGTITDLLQSPTGIADFGLRSSIRFGLIGDIEVDRATAIVPLDEAVLDRMTDSEQRRAIAQIVLTLTSFQPADQGNIGFVRFTVDDGDYSVYVPALGGASEPGEELAYSDFAELVVGIEPATTTTTVATTVPEGGESTG